MTGKTIKIIKLVLNALFNLLIDFAKTLILVAIVNAFSSATIDFRSLVIVWACTILVQIYFKNPIQAGLTIRIP